MVATYGECRDVAILAKIFNITTKTALKLYTTRIFWIPSTDYREIIEWASQIQVEPPYHLSIGNEWLLDLINYDSPVLP